MAHKLCPAYCGAYPSGGGEFLPAGGVEVALPEQQVHLRTIRGSGGGTDSVRPLLECLALLFKRGDALVRYCCHVEVPNMRSNRRFSGELSEKRKWGEEPSNMSLSVTCSVGAKIRSINNRRILLRGAGAA